MAGAVMLPTRALLLSLAALMGGPAFSPPPEPRPAPPTPEELKRQAMSMARAIAKRQARARRRLEHWNGAVAS